MIKRRRPFSSLLWWFFGGNVLTINSVLANGQKGVAYSQTLTTVGGIGSNTWSIISGSLPAGLSLNTSTGVISGTPTLNQSVTYMITVQAQDTPGKVATRTFNLIISTDFPRGYIEMELGGRDNGWTVITDVITNVDITWRRGFAGSKYFDIVADSGTLHFALDNSARSSGGLGSYSPDHVNRRFGFDLNIGVRYRINSVIRFTGFIEAIEPVPDIHGSRIVNVEAIDWMGVAGRTRLADLPMLLNKRSDEVFQILIDSLPASSKPTLTQVDQGIEMFPYALDKTRDQQTLVRDELFRIDMSAGGDRTWVKGDGTVVHESRTRRTSLTVDSDTFTNAFGFTAVRDRTDVVNSLQTTIHSRTIGTTVVDLCFLNPKTKLIPGVWQTIQGQWTDPSNPNVKISALSLEPVTAGLDYQVTSNEDGTGFDLTDQLIVGADAVGGSTNFNLFLKDTGQFSSTVGYLQSIRQRGIPLYDYGPATIPLEDSISIDQFGLNQQSVDLAYTANSDFALDLAQHVIYTKSQPVTRVGGWSRFVALSDVTELNRSIIRELGDRISITDTLTGISRRFYINAIEETQKETTVKTTFILVPADMKAYWQLEVAGKSELGSTTLLGFNITHPG